MERQGLLPSPLTTIPGFGSLGLGEAYCPKACTITQDILGVESTTSTTDTSTEDDDDGDYGDTAATSATTLTTPEPDAVGVIPVKYYYYYFIKTY